jgi:hypothetical protein
MPTYSSRQGTVLIIVAGVCALMASMALTFLMRMRSDLEESQLMVQEAQARIMLSAACTYLQEAARLGYDTPTSKSSNFHLEGHGWIDVRDGAIGPKVDVAPATSDTSRFFHTNTSTNNTTPSDPEYQYVFRQNDDSRFPIGASRRFDMYMKEIPPFAIRLNAAPNPIDPTIGIPYLSRPDPVPVLPSGNWNWGSPSASDFAEFEKGDSRPVQNSVGLSWFRLHRCGPGHFNPNYAKFNAATFIVTVGSGGTRGFRYFGNPGNGRPPEMTSSDEQLFGSREDFNTLQNAELRQWYLVEWRPAVGGQLFFNIIHHRTPKYDANGEEFAHTQYAQFPQNRDRYTHSQGKIKNFGGSISYVQRLTQEPPEW